MSTKSVFGLVVSLLLAAVSARCVLAAELNVPSPSYPTIQSAIVAADTDDVIIVAAGTHYENINFLDKQITVRSTDPSDPAVVAATIIDGGGVADVVTFNGDEPPETILTGLTITNGYGAGLYSNHAHATISNCTFSNNETWGAIGGRGMFTNCTFQSNGAYGVGGGGLVNCLVVGNGSGVLIHAGVSGCSRGVVGCVIINNDGYGIQSNDTMTNCVIMGNTLTGVYKCGDVANCLIAGNGRYGVDLTNRVANCTIVGNARAGVRWEGHYALPDYLVNSIVWGNAGHQLELVALLDGWPPDLYYVGAQVVVSYCDIQGGQAGVYIDSAPGPPEPPCSELIWYPTNIQSDPAFVDPDGPDDDPATWQDNDYHIQPTSPCVNAGDPAGDYSGQTDIDGNPRALAGRVDMGADEYVIAGDCDYDGDADLDDLAILAAAINGPDQPPGNSAADLDHDGDCDLSDFGVFAASFTGAL